MNFVFISPHFPESYWHFCAALRRNGATVLGIGDTPSDRIHDELKEVLTEYYWTPSLEDYEQVFRAVAYFSWKYGKIDWLESNNEYWLGLDARLRDDFHITTGAGSEQMARWQSKAEMKPLYAAGNVPTARQARVTTLDDAYGFANWVGYPLFVKPERGVGSGGARKIDNGDELAGFFWQGFDEPYVIEEYVTGDICSYEAILDSYGNPLFENQCEFPPSMSDVVKYQLDVAYHARPTVDPRLQELGRSAARGFGLTSRYVHMEFFRLREDKPGLAGAGDYVGLEVNVRPPGGYTPDMINFAHSVDTYQIWADMVCFNERHVTWSDDLYLACYAGRRDCHTYVHSVDEIFARYGNALCMTGRIPEALSDDLCNQMYVARLRSDEERLAFEHFVLEQV